MCVKIPKILMSNPQLYIFRWMLNVQVILANSYIISDTFCQILLNALNEFTVQD